LAAVDDFFVVLFSLTTTLSYECNQILEAIIIVVIIAGGFVAKHKNSMLMAKSSSVNGKLSRLSRLSK
jgi:hypothetical protein